MKYEPIFGDQSLFYGAPEDAVSVRYGKSEYIFDSEEIKATTGQLRDVPVVAMRRIIPAPKRWTWEDKKAGVLPEVGAKCRQGHKEETVIAVTENFVVTECLDGAVCTTRKCVFMASYSPIETPEEKAARLREEWCIKALSSCSILSGMQKYELKRLGGYIEDIYDALLSGDLPVPAKE